MNITVSAVRAQQHLLALLKIPGLSGEEMLVADYIEHFEHIERSEQGALEIGRFHTPPVLDDHVGQSD